MPNRIPINSVANRSISISLEEELLAASAAAQAPQPGAFLGGELEHEGLAGGGAWGSQPETATEQ